MTDGGLFALVIICAIYVSIAGVGLGVPVIGFLRDRRRERSRIEPPADITRLDGVLILLLCFVGFPVIFGAVATAGSKYTWIESLPYSLALGFIFSICLTVVVSGSRCEKHWDWQNQRVYENSQREQHEAEQHEAENRSIRTINDVRQAMGYAYESLSAPIDWGLIEQISDQSIRSHTVDSPNSLTIQELESLERLSLPPLPPRKRRRRRPSPRKNRETRIHGMIERMEGEQH